MKILHITECYAAGVGRAIDTFTELSAEHEHSILYFGEEDPSRNKNYAEIIEYGDSFVGRLKDTRATIQRLNPDLVIAHSSWAGAYARLVHHQGNIVYIPHCYVFEDITRSKLQRNIFKTLEKILSFNTRATVVLSQNEEQLAQSLNSKMEIIRFPNVNSINIEYRHKDSSEIKDILSSRVSDSFVVTMLGRIAPQKDPQWFLKVKENFDALGMPNDKVKFVWCGDGDEDAKKELIDSGVIVTGWSNKEAVIEYLSKTNVYLHSAQYEGFPLAVLDALALDIPTLAQKIPAYNGTPIKTAADPASAAQELLKMYQDINYMVHVVMEQAELMHEMNQQEQKKSIHRILGVIGEK